MNLHTVHILNDKLQAAIQSENLERIRTTLDEMKTEIGEIERRKLHSEALEKERKNLPSPESSIGNSREHPQQ